MEQPANITGYLCENADDLIERGWDVTGVDPSVKGISQAKHAFPELKLYKGSAYDDLADEYGQFPIVISLEVVEHVYAPREYARTVFNLLEPGGGHYFNCLPWLLEESSDGNCRQDECPLHGAIGSWAHQVLVHENVE